MYCLYTNIYDFKFVTEEHIVFNAYNNEYLKSNDLYYLIYEFYKLHPFYKTNTLYFGLSNIEILFNNIKSVQTIYMIDSKKEYMNGVKYFNICELEPNCDINFIKTKLENYLIFR